MSMLSRAAAVLLFAAAGAAQADIPIGSIAPDFQLEGMHGEPVSLSQYRGKFVVLEWSNHECPFVKHYYDRGDMQALQKTYTGKDVVWLTVVSSARDKQGWLPDAAAAMKVTADRKAAPSELLLDRDGAVGHRYDAKTTPQMFVIDPRGTLVYAGAIDGTPSADPTDIASAEPLFRAALDEALAGKPVSKPATKSYGCSIKY